MWGAEKVWIWVREVLRGRGRMAHIDSRRNRGKFCTQFFEFPLWIPFPTCNTSARQRPVKIEAMH